MQPLGLLSPLGQLLPLGRSHQLMRLSTPLGQFTPSLSPSSSAPKSFQSLGHILQASFLEKSISYRNITAAPLITSDPTVSAQLIDRSLVEQSDSLESTELEGNLASAKLEPLVQPKNLSSHKPLAQNTDFHISSFTDGSDDSDATSPSTQPNADRRSRTAIPEKIRAAVQTQLQTQVEPLSSATKQLPPSKSSVVSPAEPAQPPEASPLPDEMAPELPSVVEEPASESIQRSTKDEIQPGIDIPSLDIQTNLDAPKQAQAQAAPTAVPTRPSLESDLAQTGTGASSSQSHADEPLQLDPQISATDLASAPTTVPLIQASTTAPDLVTNVSDAPEVVSPSQPTLPEATSESSSVEHSQTASHSPTVEQAPSTSPAPAQPTIQQQGEPIPVAELPDNGIAALQRQPIDAPVQVPILAESAPPLQPQIGLPSQQSDSISSAPDSSKQGASTSQRSQVDAELLQEQDVVLLRQETQPQPVEQSESAPVTQTESLPLQRQLEPANEFEPSEMAFSTQQPIAPKLNDRESIAPLPLSTSSEVEIRPTLTDALALQTETQFELPSHTPTASPLQPVSSEATDQLPVKPSTPILPPVPTIHQTQQPIQAKLEAATSQQSLPTAPSQLPTPLSDSPNSEPNSSTEQERSQPRLDMPQLPQRPPLGLQKPLAAVPGLLQTALSDERSDIAPKASPEFATSPPSLEPTVSTNTPTVKGNAPTTWSSVAELLGESPATSHRSESWEEQFSLQAPVTEELISPWASGNSQLPMAETLIQKDTLTTPPANRDAPIPAQAVGLENSETPVDEEQMELLAQTVYRLMRDRFILDREQSHHSVAGHSHWLDVFSYSNFQSSNASTASSPMLTHQAALPPYPAEPALEALTQRTYQLLRLRLEFTRERWA